MQNEAVSRDYLFPFGYPGAATYGGASETGVIRARSCGRPLTEEKVALIVHRVHLFELLGQGLQPRQWKPHSPNLRDGLEG
jgi:hypothetical protein